MVKRPFGNFYNLLVAFYVMFSHINKVMWSMGLMTCFSLLIVFPGTPLPPPPLYLIKTPNREEMTLEPRILIGWEFHWLRVARICMKIGLITFSVDVR